MRHHLRTWLLVSLIVLVADTAFAQDLQKQGLRALSAWTNQSGSTLYIDAVAPSGQLTGSYINRAQGFGCQNTAYPVTGWVYGTAITFTVLWENAVESCNSITSWTGFYFQGTITTLWQLVINGSTSPQQIAQGSDVFQPTAQKKSPSLRSK